MGQVPPIWQRCAVRALALNPTLCTHPSALHDITQGNNGAFAAAPGWDACTGLGSPIGQQVATVID